MFSCVIVLLYGRDSVVYDILFVCKLRTTSFTFYEETSLIPHIVATSILLMNVLPQFDVNAVYVLLALAILQVYYELNRAIQVKIFTRNSYFCDCGCRFDANQAS